MTTTCSSGDRKVRVAEGNPWGIDRDHATGLCAELVAPIGSSMDSTAFSVIDGYSEDAMRTWDGP